MIPRHLARVNTWYNTICNRGTLDPYAYDRVLENCFGAVDFDSIWVPVKIPTSSGMPTDYAWVNVGYDPDEIASIYNTYFGQNFINVPLFDDTDPKDYFDSIKALRTKIEDVYKLNQYNYNKLIELGGYTYNPLYNVDGVEEFTYLENDGTVTTAKNLIYAAKTNTETGTIGKSGAQTFTNDITEKQTATYDDPTYRANEKNIHNGTIGNTNTDTFNKSYGEGAHTDQDNTTTTHGHAMNGEADYSGGTDTFGNIVIGGDRYHTEKKVRQGNIGVTKTQELIAAEREVLNFSILKQFFKDLNEVILIGIY